MKVPMSRELHLPRKLLMETCLLFENLISFNRDRRLNIISKESGSVDIVMLHVRRILSLQGSFSQKHVCHSPDHLGVAT